MVDAQVSKEEFDATVDFLWSFDTPSFKNWNTKEDVRKYVKDRITEVASADQDIFYTNSAGLLVMIDSEGNVDLLVNPLRWFRFKHDDGGVSVVNTNYKPTIRFY